ncbi:glutamate-1-semialdehyde-2,1-aminomutase [Candidatus Bathyarchaeota archaeon]|nr:MAG: glutamate-1-semialdehyde-2,1-aminomutase [Candidatus Bathyarchaeota archaeon]
MATKLASKSEYLYKRARELIPGGVNSPVRYYSPYPLFVASGKGSRFRTVDGEEFLDYCMAYGALLDGHAYEEVLEAVQKALARGSLYGQPTEMEVELASLISSLVPSMEMVRLVNSGTEATMHSLRLARAFTGRQKILKFEGGYHGAHDSVLVRAGSGASNLGIPNSEGITKDVAKDTLVAKFNDEEMSGRIIEDHAHELAAVIIEPVMGNMGPILPRPGFLETLRKITEENGVVLIFDEVITGFRIALGGAQEYFRIRPDMTVLGKILGGGLPIAAFGGRREIMEKLAPLGGVYQAGTYNGNPVSVAASLVMLQSLKRRALQLYPKLEKTGEHVRRGIRDYIESRKLAAQISGLSSMFQIFFTDHPVIDYDSAKTSDTIIFQKYFQSLLAARVFVPPSQFETCFLATSHKDDEIQVTLEAIESALNGLRP